MSGLGPLIFKIRKLNNIGRWSNEFLHMRASVAEHSFSVAQIAQMLGLVEEYAGNKIDWKSLYRKAINHDVSEALMGDVISTTKNASQASKEALRQVEKDLVEVHLLSDLKEPYKSDYRELVFDGKDSSIEGLILKYADSIDALIECIQEINLSNKDPFVDKYYMILEKIKKSDLASVQLFIEDVLPFLIQNSSLKGVD